jgi:hypothetical protein
VSQEAMDSACGLNQSPIKALSSHKVDQDVDAMDPFGDITCRTGARKSRRRVVSGTVHISRVILHGYLVPSRTPFLLYLES